MTEKEIRARAKAIACSPNVEDRQFLEVQILALLFVANAEINDLQDQIKALQHARNDAVCRQSRALRYVESYRRPPLVLSVPLEYDSYPELGWEA